MLADFAGLAHMAFTSIEHTKKRRRLRGAFRQEKKQKQPLLQAREEIT
jgi:hypothetical protein